MITSDKQYAAAKKQLMMLTVSMVALGKEEAPDLIEQAKKAQMLESVDEIQRNMEEYDRLKESKPSDIEIHSLDDLMVVPIRYRIAAHMSIDAFSRKVGVSARQISRYETENYQNTNSSTLRKILGMLDIHLNGKIT